MPLLPLTSHASIPAQMLRSPTGKACLAWRRGGVFLLLLVLLAAAGCGETTAPRYSQGELETMLSGKGPDDVRRFLGEPADGSRPELWRYVARGKQEVSGPAASYWQTMDVFVVFDNNLVREIRLVVNRQANGARQ